MIEAQETRHTALAMLPPDSDGKLFLDKSGIPTIEAVTCPTDDNPVNLTSGLICGPELGWLLRIRLE